jgi:hypothetical protein
MAHPVSDSRHAAKDAPRRWVPAADSGWAEEDGAFRHDEPRDEPAWLRYRHHLRDDERPRLITDFNGYNGIRAQRGGNWVSDLILECDLGRFSAGTVTLELSRGRDRFQARVSRDGRCAILRLEEGKEPTTLKEAAARVGDRARLRFAHVDERLTLWVDGALPFGDGVEYDGPPVHVPTEANDLQRPASVGVAGGAVTVTRLRLSRDVYYTAAVNRDPGGFDVDFDDEDASTWKGFEDAPIATHRIEPGHCFFLGDNTRASADSRLWGTVKQSAVVGRVLYRYYPPGRIGPVD